MSKFLIFLIGLNVGLYAPIIVDKILKKYHEYKLLKSFTQLKKTILELKQKTQPETLNIDFNKRKHEIAYKNKVERVKSKIDELERSNIHKQIAEAITGQIMVQLADTMVEADRKNGKIDDLYSKKEEKWRKKFMN